MKILVLTPVVHISGITEKLREFSSIVHMPDAGYEEVKLFISKYHPDALFVNPNRMKYRIDMSLLIGTSIKAVCTASTGTNHIDMKYCEVAGINVISLTKEYDVIEKISSTAEHALGLTLSLIRNIPRAYGSVMKGEWDYTGFIGRQISSMTVGVIGFGRLGRKYAKYCSSFGSRILIFDPYIDIDDYKSVPNSFQVSDHKHIAEESDIVSIHVHVAPDTIGMINNAFINETERGFYLINTSRGDIVNEEDVLGGIDSGKILGYATDVLSDEFGNVQNSKMTLAAKEGKNIIITPHIGGMTMEAQELAYGHSLDNLIKFCARSNPAW